MPKYRHNLVTNRWVIIAADRGSRPYDFAKKGGDEDGVSHDEGCPFCEGNEGKTPEETFVVRESDGAVNGPGWTVRVFPNKYPFLTPDAKGDVTDEYFSTMPANGVHEVLVESVDHGRHFARLEKEQGELVIRTLRDRYLQIAMMREIQHVSVFCNHGRGAGASLMHPHFQIAASTMVPGRLAGQMAYCKGYYRGQERSVFQVMLEHELRAEKRIIAENHDFVMFCPSASMCAYEVWIVPRGAMPQFGHLPDEMIGGLVELLQQGLGTLDKGMNNPDYNLVVHSAGTDVPGGEKAYRWYLQIYPRLTVPGGYEIATDVYINAVSPERAAEFYRGEE